MKRKEELVAQFAGNIMQIKGNNNITHKNSFIPEVLKEHILISSPPSHVNPGKSFYTKRYSLLSSRGVKGSSWMRTTS